MQYANSEAKPVALVGEGKKFERIRRITGYLVGTLDRFNNAKRQEEAQRVKHLTSDMHIDVPDRTLVAA